MRKHYVEWEYKKHKDLYDKLHEKIVEITKEFIPLDKDDQSKFEFCTNVDKLWFDEDIIERTQGLFELYFYYMVVTTKKYDGLNINDVRTFIKELPGSKKILRISNELLGQAISSCSFAEYILDGSIRIESDNYLLIQLKKLEEKHNIDLKLYYEKCISVIINSIKNVNQKRLLIQNGISINSASDKLLSQFNLLYSELQDSFHLWNDFDGYEPVLKRLKENTWNETDFGVLIKGKVAYKVFYEAQEAINFLMFEYPRVAKNNNIELLVASIATNDPNITNNPSLTENIYEQIKKIIKNPYPNEHSIAILQLESKDPDNFCFEEIKSDNEVNGLNQPQVIQIDIGVVVALEEELQPLLDIKEIKWEKVETEESITYYKGEFSKNDTGVSIVAALCPQMGMAASTWVSMDMISKYNPKYLTMIGIAAGIKENDVGLGDILVAENSFDYGSGKIKTIEGRESKFEPDYRHIPINKVVLNKLKEKHDAILEKLYLEYLKKDQFSGNYPEQPPKKRIGPVASGAMVVAHADVTEEVLKHERKLVGIDMETYGVYFAAVHFPNPPKFFSMKAVCDFANDEKNDKYHDFACFISANYLFRFFLTLNF